MRQDLSALKRRLGLSEALIGGIEDRRQSGKVRQEKPLPWTVRGACRRAPTGGLPVTALCQVSKAVYRNRLIESIQYSPATEQVHAELECSSCRRG